MLMSDEEIECVQGEMFCIVCGAEVNVCYHSPEQMLKALQVEREKKNTARRKVDQLRKWPKQHGIPALKAVQTGWDDVALPRVEEALEHAKGPADRWVNDDHSTMTFRSWRSRRGPATMGMAAACGSATT